MVTHGLKKIKWVCHFKCKIWKSPLTVRQQPTSIIKNFIHRSSARIVKWYSPIHLCAGTSICKNPNGGSFLFCWQDSALTYNNELWKNEIHCSIDPYLHDTFQNTDVRNTLLCVKNKTPNLRCHAGPHCFIRNCFVALKLKESHRYM